MNSKELVTYSFWWSEIRLIVAALALLLGGVPPIFLIAPPALSTLTYLALKLCWILSGVAAGYLLYSWYTDGQKLFGHKDHQDTIAFLVLCVSGLNLGFAGIFSTNIGMSISSNRIIFVLVAALYIYSAFRLWTHAQKHGGKLFA